MPTERRERHRSKALFECVLRRSHVLGQVNGKRLAMQRRERRGTHSVPRTLALPSCVSWSAWGLRDLPLELPSISRWILPVRRAQPSLANDIKSIPARSCESVRRHRCVDLSEQVHPRRCSLQQHPQVSVQVARNRLYGRRTEARRLIRWYVPLHGDEHGEN